MSFSFPFFSSKRPADPAQVGQEADMLYAKPEAEAEDECFLPSPFPKSPFLNSAPADAPAFTLLAGPTAETDWENMPTFPLPSTQAKMPTSLPEKRSSPRGLAAMVVNQSELETPPVNRRPTSPFPAQPCPPVTGTALLSAAT